jgi:hypothetical protein
MVNTTGVCDYEIKTLALEYKQQKPLKNILLFVVINFIISKLYTHKLASLQ